MQKLLILLVSSVLVASFPAVGAAQTQYNTSPGAQTGVQAYGSYFGADVDTISLYNGNVMLNIGLFSLPGRELSTGLAVNYNNQKWESKWCGGIPCGLYTGGWRVTNPFGDLSVYTKILGSLMGPTGSPYYIPSNSCRAWFEMNVYWLDGVGTKHRYVRIHDSGNYVCTQSPTPTYDNKIFDGVDDRGKMVTTSWDSGGNGEIFFSNGNVLKFQQAAGYKLTTPNGNYLVQSTNGSKLPSQDTLGRTIAYSAGTINSTADTYTTPDANATNRTYSIKYKTITAYDPYRDGNNNQTIGNNRTVIDYITLANGKQWLFEYNHQQGFLTKVTYPSGAYIKYVYAGGAVTSAQQYSGNDYLIERRVSADGSTEKVWTYSRDDSGGNRTITVLSPEEDVVVHTFNAQGVETQTQWKASPTGPVLKTVATTWDQNAVESNNQPNNPRVTTITTTLDNGLASTRTLTYNTTTRQLTNDKTTAWGASTIVAEKAYTYTTWGWAWNWVTAYRVASEILSGIDPVTNTPAVQGKKEFFYDEGSVTDRGTSVPNHTNHTGDTYSSRGNLTRVRTYKDANNYVDNIMKYDSVGNLVETIDPLSHSTTVDFTDNFTDSTNRYTFAYPKKVTNPLSHEAASQYDFNTGLVKEVTNLRGYTTTTAYDLLNRITTVTEPNNKQTTYAYDDTNRKTTKEVTVDSSGNKGHVETYFDKLYRVVKTITNDPEGAITVESEYDNNGRVKKTSNPYRSGQTVVWTQNAYDALSRPITVTAPDTSTVQYAYSNNITTTTDQAGNARSYTYNVLGQLITVEEPNPTLANAVTTSYKYYGFGPLYQSTQSAQTRTWVYNWLGQLTSQTLPESGTTSFTYDGAGRLSTKTDARSVTVTNSYDNANRLTGQTYSDSTPSVSFTYDQSSQKGLRTAMSDGLGQVNYTYDSMDRLTQETRALAGVSGTFSTSYVYNVKGDVTQMTYPSGRVVNFAYATGGGCCNSRLSSVADGTTSTTLMNSIAFSAAGAVLTRTLNPGSNSIGETFTYNNRLQLTQIQAVRGSTTIMDFSYTYGTSANTGRVISRTDAIQPEHSANYSYDSLYRLRQAVSSNSSWSIAWTFDTWGNRLSQTPEGLAVGRVGSQSLSYEAPGGITNNRQSATYLTHDAAGNMTHEAGTGTHGYAYNANNQMVSMDGSAATYAYDGEGRRMKRTVGSETTYTFYGPGGVLCEFTTTNTGATAASSSDRTVYRTSERTGTALLLINSSGTVIENNRTLPYGEAWLTDVASTNDKKFTTYDRDKESGLDYAMNRMYANTGGRMTSPDKGKFTLNIPSTLNRYTYAIVDPINFRDPDGNTPMIVFSRDICDFFGGTVVGEGYDDWYVGEYYYECEIDESYAGWVRDMGAGYVDDGGGGGDLPAQQAGPAYAMTGNYTFNSPGGYYRQLETLRDMMIRLADALSADSNCASFLGGLGPVTRKMTEFREIAGLSVSTYSGPGVPPVASGDSNGITVNVDGSFYTTGGIPNPYGYNNGSAQFQIFTLIHEMGHVMGIGVANHYNLDGSRNENALNRYNDAIKDRDICGNLIGGF